MSSIQKSIRLPQDAVRDIEHLAKAAGKDFSGLARDLIVEAVKLRKCPGIVFTDGASGRRARIAGSGVDVWEMVATFRGVDQDYEKLKSAYHWLSEAQIRAGLSYFALYQEEIDDLIEKNEQLTETQILKKFPFLAKLESVR